MASTQYEDQFADGEKVVDGDQVMHEVTGDRGAGMGTETGCAWMVTDRTGLETRAQGAAQAWDDFEPGESMPLGQGWGGKRSKRSKRTRH
jgi:hypothetical protein